jgi:prolipoprotein diacylglyceryl transferase
MTAFITWTADPDIFTIGTYEFRWYTLSFAIGFYVGFQIVSRMWKNENLKPEWIESLLFYTFFGTLIGARLGHCLFYAPAYYLSNPLEILKMWEGGLASHGGTLGIIIAVYIYSRRVTHKDMLWTFDKLVVPTGLVAALIRLGNLMNHEIYGHPTDLPWGFRFIENLHAWKHGAVPVFTPPCHPTQLYEAAIYLFTFALCLWLYFRKKAYLHKGLIF